MKISCTCTSFNGNPARLSLANTKTEAEFLRMLIERSGSISISWEGDPSHQMVISLLRLEPLLEETYLITGKMGPLKLIPRYLESSRRLRSATMLTPRGKFFTKDQRDMVLYDAICKTDPKIQESELWDLNTEELLARWEKMFQQ